MTSPASVRLLVSNAPRKAPLRSSSMRASSSLRWVSVGGQLLGLAADAADDLGAHAEQRALHFAGILRDDLADAGRQARSSDALRSFAALDCATAPSGSLEHRPRRALRSASEIVVPASIGRRRDRRWTSPRAARSSASWVPAPMRSVRLMAKRGQAALGVDGAVADRVGEAVEQVLHAKFRIERAGAERIADQRVQRVQTGFGLLRAVAEPVRNQGGQRGDAALSVLRFVADGPADGLGHRLHAAFGVGVRPTWRMSAPDRIDVTSGPRCGARRRRVLAADRQICTGADLARQRVSGSRCIRRSASCVPARSVSLSSAINE